MDKKLSLGGKYVFTILWSILFGIVTLGVFINNVQDLKFLSLSFWIGGTVVGYLHMYNLKRVELSGNNLVISSDRKSINIPISEIEKVTMGFSDNISIYFKNPTIFGNKIKFRPAYRWWRPYKCDDPFNSHPIYIELKEIVDNNRS